ncbi:MAG TPA: hypothetical protein VKE51_01160 [Vicinamibacterales bacterium]|nr:hypothetical protein [Vicinamibacterales bacterium]
MFSIERRGGQTGAVAVLSTRTGQKRVLVEDAAYGRLADTGHLLFVRGGDLLGTTFNQSRLEISGESIVVQPGIGYQPGSASADFTFAAASGSAAMVFRDSRYIDQSSFVWVNRQGRGTPTELVERGFRQPRLSRDGQRLLVDIRDGRSRDISIYDFRRSQLSRLTTDEGETPMWSPDESSMAWAGGADGKYHILLKRSDGSDAEHRIWSTDEHIHLNAWTPDGKSLLVNATHGQRQTLVEVTLQPSISARPFRESKFNEYGAAISPDGRRVAFVSDEAGHADVYLTARNGVGKVQVSSAGGTEPVWSGDGRELFYRSGRRLMSVATGTAALDVGPSRLLFDGPYITSSEGRDPSYAVSPDGQRFLMMQPVRAEGAEVVVTLNWLEELRTRMLAK